MELKEFYDDLTNKQQFPEDMREAVYDSYEDMFEEVEETTSEREQLTVDSIFEPYIHSGNWIFVNNLKIVRLVRIAVACYYWEDIFNNKYPLNHFNSYLIPKTPIIRDLKLKNLTKQQLLSEYKKLKDSYDKQLYINEQAKRELLKNNSKDQQVAKTLRVLYEALSIALGSAGYDIQKLECGNEDSEFVETDNASFIYAVTVDGKTISVSHNKLLSILKASIAQIHNFNDEESYTLDDVLDYLPFKV